MNNKCKKIICVFVLTCMFLIQPYNKFSVINTKSNSVIVAGVGNHSSSSASHSSSSTSHSSGSSSFGSNSSSFSSHVGGGSLSTGTIIILVIIFIGYIILKKKGIVPVSDNNSSEYTPSSDIKNYNSEISAEITKTDKDFTVSKFLGWSQEVFLKLQEAWTKKDWAVIRPFEKEELFAVHNQQLQEYIDNHTTNKLERVCINQAYLHRYETDEEYEYLQVLINATLNDYTINDETQEVIDGNKYERYTVSYVLTFARKKGVLTHASSSNLSTKQCPNCGAPIQITSAGKCEYCDCVVTTGDHDWVLTDYDQVDDNTPIDNGGVYNN